MVIKSVVRPSIQLYSDGADQASMLEMAANPLVSGLTTNPSLMKKAGVKDYRSYAKGILAQIREKPISFEVFADEFGPMAQQADEIRSWADNVYVKIPVMNSKGQSTLPLVRDLTNRGVKLNVTALMTVQQVAETCAVLKGGAPSIVSVFAGRIADTGRDPMPILRESAKICETTDASIQLLWASTRELYNIYQAQDCGCKIITVPPDILKKLSGLGRDLDQLSLDTVQTFKKDSDSAGFSL